MIARVMMLLGLERIFDCSVNMNSDHQDNLLRKISSMFVVVQCSPEHVDNGRLDQI
jgi:ribosomal protein L30/L7E